MTDSELIVREMLRDPAMMQALRVCAELSSGEDLMQVDLDVAEWQLAEAKLTFCPNCHASVIGWPDGVMSNWPDRSLHDCPAIRQALGETFR